LLRVSFSVIVSVGCDLVLTPSGGNSWATAKRLCEGVQSAFYDAVDEKRKVMGSETTDLSPRLAAIVDALPLRPGLRVLEIGCGPGAAARAVARRVGNGHVLAIDRSAKAVEQARRGAEAEIAAGLLIVRQAAAENLELEDGEALYDIAFAVRVGALDGRHPEAGKQALRRIAAALTPGGRLFIDGGDPLREVPLGVVR